MTITIIHVEVKQIVEEEVLHYKEVTKSDNTLAKGKTKIKTQGENGLQKNTIEVTYKNGVEVSRKTVSEEIVKKPVDKVTLVGTYVAPAKKPSTGSGGSGSKPSSGGNSNSGGSSSKPDYSTDDSGKLTKVPSTSEIHSAGSLYEHKKAPAPASSIIKKTMVMNSITAYTHTGNRTATGVWPKMGTIAADPKQIPYGTKIYVPGYGYGRIEDTGSNRHDADYYCIDLFMETKSECTTWGRKRNWKIYILG